MSDCNATNLSVTTNTVVIQDVNRRIDIVVPNCNTTVSVTQPVTNVVTIAAPGPQGITGPPGADADITGLNAFTGSIQSQVNNLTNATSSYLLINVTSSMLQPYVLTNVTASMIVSGALTASFYREIDPIFVAKSGSFAITGSNTFIGNQIVSGSITISNIGYIQAPSFTGSLFGTASWANNAITASFITSSNVYGPYGSNSIISASYAVTASNVNPLIQDVQLTGSLLINSGSLIIDPGNIIVSGGYVTTLHSSTNLEDFSSAFNYAGQVLQGVALDTNAPVALYDLVYLENGNIWYRVENHSPSLNTTNRKLGIVVVDNSNGTGNVLLEGDIVVNYSGTGNGPRIYSLNILKPGELIYIGEFNPYPGGSMANDMPGTGATLRTLGHLYYNNIDTNNNNWILRFNPSNDYYYLS